MAHFDVLYICDGGVPKRRGARGKLHPASLDEPVTDSQKSFIYATIAHL